MGITCLTAGMVQLVVENLEVPKMNFVYSNFRS